MNLELDLERLICSADVGRSMFRKNLQLESCQGLQETGLQRASHELGKLRDLFGSGISMSLWSKLYEELEKLNMILDSLVVDGRNAAAVQHQA